MTYENNSQLLRKMALRLAPLALLSAACLYAHGPESYAITMIMIPDFTIINATKNVI